MRIGKVARQLGTSVEAVRFYERAGIVPSARRAANGYRDYDATAVERLRCLIGFRQLDLSLPHAAALASQCVDGRCDLMVPELRRLIADKRAQVRARMAGLRYLEQQLALVERDLEGAGSNLITISRKGGAT
jgi:DNA-binding transcriptional MerR regulator